MNLIGRIREVYPHHVEIDLTTDMFKRVEVEFGILEWSTCFGYKDWQCNDKWTFLNLEGIYFKFEEDALKCKLMFG